MLRFIYWRVKLPENHQNGFLPQSIYGFKSKNGICVTGGSGRVVGLGVGGRGEGWGNEDTMEPIVFF